MKKSATAIRQITASLTSTKAKYSDSDVSVQVRLFLIERRTRNCSAKTLEFYKAHLDKFLWWAGRHGVKELGDLTPARIREFAAYLQEVTNRWEVDHPGAKKRLQPSTVHTYLAALRAFCKWLVEEEEIDVDPFKRVKMPSVPKKVIPVFTQEQLTLLLAETGNGKRNGLRNQAIVWLLYDTGIRAAELCGLHLADVGDGQIKVLGKGQKERYAPLGAKCLRALLRYLSKEREESTDTHLFLSERGDKLSPRQLSRTIAELGKRAGINGVRCSPHTFRHTNGTSRLRAGWDLRTLQQALGHTTLNMVGRYLTAVNDDDVSKAHAAKGIGDSLPVKVK